MQDKEQTLNLEEICECEKSFNKVGKGVVSLTEEECLLLLQGSNENFIDYTKCDAKVVRGPISKGEEKTIAGLPKGSFMARFNTAEDLSMEDVKKVIKQALQEEGYEIKPETETGNDLCDSNGNKVCGILQIPKADHTSTGFFLANKDAANSGVTESVHFPQEYKERKQVDEAEKRFGHLEDFDYKSFCRSLEQKFEERGVEMSFVDSKPELENAEQHIEYKP